ncbi:MAG: hypothetical protein S4CHLAM102_06600 [Chlamydiia bacterium]|nr:hypothetical protein [Chlamydiia bacterium]
MYRLIALLLLSTLFFGCQKKQTENGQESDTLVNIQLIDRNGFNEAVTQKDRLSQYEKNNYLKPQPYEKVIRTFKKDGRGIARSKATSYHSNGQIHQYLEILGGRANGLYQEWYANGQVKIIAHVVEGIGDLGEGAQSSWMFDGTCQVFAEEGSLRAEIVYERGELVGNSTYYYPNGTVEKVIPYVQNAIQGELCTYAPDGSPLSIASFEMDVPHGNVAYLGSVDHPPYTEKYVRGKLMEGEYYDFENTLLQMIRAGYGTKLIYEKGTISQEVEYQDGVAEGVVREYYPTGALHSTRTIVDGDKHGEELFYYPSSADTIAENRVPKLSITWYKGNIHGRVKTWYENGQLESDKEYSNNKRIGMSLAWYKDGNPMLIEEYEGERLLRGRYLKKGEAEPVSKVIGGNGIATIYDADGMFLRKVPYRKGVVDSD